MSASAGFQHTALLSRRGLLASLAAAPVAAFAQHFPAGRLAGDIALLRDAYTTLHPGLYRYATVTGIQRQLDALETLWSGPISRIEAYLSLSRFAASLKCGHSYANFYNQSPAVVDALFVAIPRLPFLFRWLDGHMVVTHNQSLDPRLVPGTVVHSVNGENALDILTALMPYTRADGGNDAKRRALLDVRGEEDWEYFDIFYGLLHRDTSSFRLEATGPDGSRFTTQLPSISLAGRRGPARQKPDKDANPWRFDWAGKTGILTMPGWALYNSRWDWKAWLADRMQELADRKADGLVIDLRGNEGGLDCGNQIIAHLIDAPLVAEPFDRLLRYRRVPDRLIPFLDTWDRSFDRLGEDADELANGFYRQAVSSQTVIAPATPRFKGKIVVITEPMNSSATFQFAKLIKDHRLGTLVGSAAGGNRRGLNGGAFYFLRLPESGLEIDLPLIGYYAKGRQPDAGILPDIPVTQRPADIAAGQDTVLARAMEAVAQLAR